MRHKIINDRSTNTNIIYMLCDTKKTRAKSTDLMEQVRALCASLRSYYKSHGKEDSYVDENGVGKFEAWCDENGIDDGELEENFQSVDDCLFLDFDDDFPLSPGQQELDDDAKKEVVFDILMKCRAGHNFDNNYKLDYDQSSFDAVNTSDVQHIQKLYETYCPILYNREMGTDGNLLLMLALQKKYNVDYLSNLIDSFSRYRIEHEPNVKEMDWALLPDNKHFKSLRKVKVNVSGSKSARSEYKDFAPTSMASFNHRCCGKLQFGGAQSTLINDSIEKIAQYISAAASFVFNTLTTNTGGTLVAPFQFDVAIAVGEPVTIRREDEDEDEDDDDDDEDDDQPSSGQDTKYLDWIQDVQKKLDANKLKYSRVEAADADDNRRRFGNMFKQFVAEHKIDEIDDSQHHYLHSKRLIALIDRRQSKENEAQKDDIFMYEPPAGRYTRDIPQAGEFLGDWFLSASKTSVLPPNDTFDAEVVVGNKQMEQKDASKANEPGGNVGAADPVSGAMITLSFWVYSAEKTKLYLYYNGGMIRMLPKDIQLLLPKIFVKSEKNAKYVSSDALKLLVKDLEGKLIDREFEEWMKTYPLPKKR